MGRGCLDIPHGTVVKTSTMVHDDIPSGPMKRSYARQMVAESCNNYYVRWFCGHDDVCMDPSSDEAFRRALTNIRDHHIVVGTVEDLNVTLAVLGKLLPDVFEVPVPQDTGTSAAGTDLLSLLQEVDPHRQRGTFEYYVDADRFTRAALAMKNNRDTILYQAVRSRLMQQAVLCSV